ncbi:hypothetical protein [Citrobacter meridianamericanus]|uniref:hypothetical protein n=1 Tax=Citrobacter meridianamericanus TaxID=2894201 RepID=UPI00351DA04A
MANELTGTICNMVDKVCQSVSIDVTSVPVSLSLSSPVYSESAPFFIIGFSSVLILWLTSHCVGLLLGMIKRG